MSSFSSNVTPQTSQTIPFMQMGTGLANNIKTDQGPNDQCGVISQKQDNLSGNDVKGLLDKLNSTLTHTGLKMEVDPKEPTNKIWINLVDQSTGQIVQRFPPEGLRHMEETGQPKGFSINHAE